jgi:imidazole glycerol-phosphate synthase subunit HisF
MLRPRVIPCLLLEDGGLVKTVRFKDPVYLGDPINIVRIFNDKEVDELVFLDIRASVEGRRPPFDLLAQITTECFMPLCYGGGVTSVEDVRELVALGIEKVAINSRAVADPAFVRAAADQVGSSSVVVSIDVRRDWRGRYEVMTHGGRRSTGLEPALFAVEAERHGAGELLVTAIDRDGTMQGYDLELVRRVSDAVGVPVIACGGARSIADLRDAVKVGGASAAAAGSMFVFQGRHRAVLINTPSPADLRSAFSGSPG